MFERVALLPKSLPFLLIILPNLLELRLGQGELLFCLSDVVESFLGGSQALLLFVESRSFRLEFRAIRLEFRALGCDFPAVLFEFLMEFDARFLCPP